MYFRTALTRKKPSVQEISIYSHRDGGIDNYHLSEELYTFTALENLYISEDFLAISPKIAQLQQLKSLSLRSRMLKTLPEEIGKLQQLRALSISGDLFEALPESIAQLQNLEYLYLNSCPKMSQLPHSLRYLPKLKTLYLHHSPWEDLTAFEEGFDGLRELRISHAGLGDAQITPIFGLKKLHTLNLPHNQLTQFPEELTELSALIHLSIAHNNLTHIPTSILSLSELQSFNFEHNQVQQFPVFLEELPFLSKLGWQGNAFGKYDQGLLEFPITTTNPYRKTGEHKKYQDFLEQVMAADFSTRVLPLFFDIQNGKDLEQGKWERADFLELLNFDNKNFKSIVIDQLLAYEAQQLEQHPLTPATSLLVLGKATISKNAIRALLKEKSIAYQTKLTPKTTHLLVGNTGIKEKDYLALANPAHTLISMPSFQEYMNAINKPYLLEEEAQDNLAHVGTLLTSSALENQQLGMELLQGGGTPKELLTELFIVYKFSEDKKLAAKAKKMLQANASTALLEKLKLRINLRTVKEAYHTKNKIEELTEGTELETWKVAQYAVLLNPKIWGGKTFLGLKDAPETAIAEFLPKAITLQSPHGSYTVEPSLLPYIHLVYQYGNFLEQLQFTKKATNLEGIAQMDQLQSVSFYFIKELELPADLHLLPNLRQVSFTSISLPDWGAVLEQLSHCFSLRTLYLWSSMRTGLHPKLLLLQQLERISITRALLEEQDLALLAQLPQLKMASFDNTSANLEEFYLQLQQIESLYFYQSEPYSITPKLSQLQQLTTLNLKGPFSLEGSLQLPQLKHLHLETNYRKRQPILPHHLQQLTHLTTLEIRGEVINLAQILPHFKQLEKLTLLHNTISVQELITALQQLPQLQFLKRYFSAPDLQLMQQAFPELEIRS